MILGATSGGGEAAPAAILVVDDNPANLLAFEAILVPLGAPIVQARSGEDALRRLLERPFAVLLLDVQMPGMNGFELAALIRAHPRLAYLPIILVTALSAEPANVFTGYARGAVDYLVKPIEPEILRAKVNVFLELHRHQQTILQQAKQLHAHEMRAIERRDEARRHRVTEAIPIPVWWVEDDGRIRFCNRAWSEYSGLTAEETGTVTSGVAVHPDDVSAVAAAWTRGVATHDRFEFECRLRSKQQGDYRWHLLSAAPDEAKGAPRSLWTIAALDVETQKQHQRERALVLEREQHAREAAEEANRAKDNFIATVSHELRTPLNAILGWASIIRSGALGPGRLSHAVETIEHSARTQARLINDLLDVSRIVRGKLRLQVESLELSGVVSDAVETLRPAAEAKGIRLAWEPPAERVEMHGDDARLQQIICNLLTNAIKFTPNGGRVTVTLSTAHDTASVRVEDTGPGIPADLLPHVFERFRQAESPTTKKHDGLGLGLSIVKSLTALHGGSVAVESEGAGRGSAFTVTFPLGALSTRQIDLGHLEVVRRFDEALSANLPRLDGISVVFVEDRVDVRERVEALLAGCRARVMCAATAEEGVRLVAERCPDVLLSDVGLRDEDGYALMRRVRALPGRASEVIGIALTAYSRAADGRRAREAGFHAHLLKPVEPSELVSLVASLVPDARGATDE